MRAFEHFQPSNLKEAIKILSTKDKEARVIAGGTDLLNAMRDGEESPECIVDLKGLKGLDYIKYKEKEGLRIGSLTKLGSIEKSSIVKKKYPVLCQAAHSIGSVQIRNMATIGGNLCNAAPSADMAPALIALEAECKVQGAKGKRTISLEDFFAGPGETVLKKGEILTEIIVPKLAGKCFGVYIKHGLRKAMDIAIAGVCVIITKERGKLKGVRIALGAVAPTPIRAKNAEKILLDGSVSEDAITEAAEEAAKACFPISDVRSSEWYRREIVKVLVRRGLRECLEKV
ncbi:MAG: hypothetical protein A2042_03705 [Candidatus Schekmanbacteria bacterium GWA2_38_11]|uniref:FAD-binding PCMH-type domain-containing protein n=1 Tax=Candidatus Schekmanbacteria bacterium GWA2_38_11 TaxID=1817876 RepID=A0A1F7RJE3_9BACT|nr:MAG: hypothetical protein A2042_03705 [Candidatus Schekmanbacteria bacterium GWA2_38_11]